MTVGRYVEVPGDRLVAELDQIAQAVVRRGGCAVWSVSGRERVLDLQPAGFPMGTAGLVRLYTSLAVGASAVRGCGEDAVRIVVGFRRRIERDGRSDEVFVPTEKGTRIYRTAPAAAEDRVAVFLERLRVALRDAYGRALRIPRCPACQAPMVPRKGKSGPFLGCSTYPTCRGTRPLEER